MWPGGNIAENKELVTLLQDSGVPSSPSITQTGVVVTLDVIIGHTICLASGSSA